MTILKKAFAVLTSCALMLSLAACNSEPQETIVEKPEDISDHAIVVDYLGMAVELPDAIYDRLGEQVFPTANSPIAPEGVTVNGQVLFLYQSGAVYDRVLELQSTGEAMSEEEYLTLSEQAGNLCAITSIKADTLGENNLADCTGFENNELIGELGGNSFYLSNDNLSPESLSEEDAADLQAMKDSLPELASNLVLYTPIESTAQGVEEGGEVCTLPSGEEVNFYQVIPLYRNEMEYKMEHDADALLKKMAGISFVVNPTRQNAITRGTLAEEEFTGDMDDAAWHLESIQEKGLPVNEINAYNHMAIYLRWCMEHDLMSAEFMERYWEQVQPFMADLSRADLRGFIRDQLKGQLFGALFNKEGAAFAGYYYGEADSPYFPSDIDNYALEYFGSEQYYSDKFQNEAYLFIPFDENYYQAMAKVIEKRFVNWQGQDFDEDTLEPSELAEAMMEYLDCECTYFPSMTDDDPIMSAYNYAKRESVKEGFVPVLMKADDEILWECLIMNSDPDSDGEDDYAFDPDKVAEYRKKMLSAPIKDGRSVLEEMIGQRKAEAEDDEWDWDEDVLGEMEGGYDNRRFSSYWNSDNNMTYPLILAKIPVKNPWEIFAYLPFGGWNECPNTPELMAVAKYWFEQHGAVPAAMSHDELEFLLPAPVSEEKAMDAAVELYGFCPDVIDQGPEDATVGALADVLRQSTVWYFWWD